MNTWTVAEWKDLIEWTAFVLVIALASVLWLISIHRPDPAPVAPELDSYGFDAVCDAVAAALGDAYDCTRVWQAWGVGTMSQDDFSSVAEDPDRVAEIAHAAVDAYRAAMTKGGAA
ncbi:hypothetical protein ABL850_15870 [Variovorax paradoxus]|uniref:hypothetical protein n=1 Tax=Variovorax paradoxus TaxID=34073 RepID=UPI003AADF35C